MGEGLEHPVPKGEVQVGVRNGIVASQSAACIEGVGCVRQACRSPRHIRPGEPKVGEYFRGVEVGELGGHRLKPVVHLQNGPTGIARPGILGDAARALYQRYQAPCDEHDELCARIRRRGKLAGQTGHLLGGHDRAATTGVPVQVEGAGREAQSRRHIAQPPQILRIGQDA